MNDLRKPGLIDRDRLMMHLSDIMLTESPGWTGDWTEEDEKQKHVCEGLKKAESAVEAAEIVEAIPIDLLCNWLSHYAAPPVRTGQEPVKSVGECRMAWEKWFRVYFWEWVELAKAGKA